MCVCVCVCVCVCLTDLYSPIFIGVPGGCLISDTFVNEKVLMPAISVSKGYLAIKPSHHSHPSGEPWANSRWKQNTHHQALTYPKDAPWGDSGWENRILAPESWGAHQRNDFSEPRLLHLPIHRKVLNFLKWNVWFSLIYCYLSVFLTTLSLLQNSCISWLLPYLFGVVPWSYLRGFAPELCPQFCPPNKTFRFWIFFSQLIQFSRRSPRFCFLVIQIGW